MSRIAILIDGGFFLKRLPKLVTPEHCNSPEGIAKCVRRLCFNHVAQLVGKHPGRNWQEHIYRIFFYDAQPYDGKAHHPIDNHPIDFGKSPVAAQRLALFEQLRKERKLALRLGKVNRDHDWALAPSLTKKVLKTRQALAPLQALGPQLALPEPSDTINLQLSRAEAQQLAAAYAFWQELDGHSVSLGLRQKGVDMRIGVDIASLTLKKQATTLILVAGDSDFVPAAKLARREGMEFILDPLWQQVNADLFEHIDGLQSGLKRPQTAPMQPQQN